MATPKKNENGDELSMEEILQSIKKIIADEEDAPPTVETPEDETYEAASVDEEPAPSMGSDVLELTDMVAVEEAPMESIDVLQEIDAAVGASEEPLTLTEVAPDETTAPAEAMPAAEAPATPVAATPKPATNTPAKQDSDVQPQSSRLLSDSAASVSAAAFQKVIQTHKATTPMPQFRNSETIEDLVLETLKPLLKEWLDTNLPPMVERIVEREISKLVD